jgi:hypothetical protein
MLSPGYIPLGNEILVLCSSRRLEKALYKKEFKNQKRYSWGV